MRVGMNKLRGLKDSNIPFSKADRLGFQNRIGLSR
jgi:hypothetical protein